MLLGPLLCLAERADRGARQADERGHPGVGGGQRLDGGAAGGVADRADESGVHVAVERARWRRVLRTHEGDGRLEVPDIGRRGRRSRGTAEDLGEVSAEVVGRGDDEAPGGQTGGEKGRLVPEAGVAVAEHHERVAARSDRYAAHSSARVADREPGGDQLLQGGRQPTGDVVRRLGLSGDARPGGRIPHLHGRTVCRQRQRRLADAEGPGPGEAGRPQVRDGRHGVAVHDLGAGTGCPPVPTSIPPSRRPPGPGPRPAW